ncbi:hypothetical protein [Mycobacterium sp. E1747]|uniref:hypothetical protein n=1 Tax=Mycobacterium sp. E1747 TaxID=1834128 RepID=UPI000A7EB1ED|nr:hypothetical protein [Mycobacterium sp. E1747]
MSTAFRSSRHWPMGPNTRAPRWRALLAMLLVLTYGFMAAVVATQARAAVGDLGPPPSEPEIRQTITDFYSIGQPPGTEVNVDFIGPITLGQVVQHDNPDSSSSPMYPVNAQVRVTIKYVTHSVFDPEQISTVDYYGPPPTGDGSYYFFRDDKGHWQVPAPTCTRCPKQ